MTTLNQLTYDLLGVLRAGGLNISDDDGITLRQIAFWVKNTRANLIRQQLTKRQSVSDNIVQTLKCLSVSQVDASTCCDVSSDCYLVRTDSRIPMPLEANQKDLIERVIPQMVGAKPYPFIPYARAPFWGNSMFNKNQPAAFLYDGYIYIMNSDFVDTITVQGVFDDPVELADVANCDGTLCYTDNDRYPVSAHMIEIMKKMIIDTNFKTIMVAPVDRTNNAESDVTPNVNRDND